MMAEPSHMGILLVILTIKHVDARQIQEMWGQ